MSGSWGRRGDGLALVGYRGTGKSTVGRLLADRLGRPFVDADREIEARAGRTIRAIFAEQGEPAFRDLEELVLADLADRGGVILAAGGGAVLRASNREALRRVGFVVRLLADPDAIARRIEADPRALGDRPALTDLGTLGEIRRVLIEREPLYREAADAEVDTDGRSPDQVADAVISAWMGGGPH